MPNVFDIIKRITVSKEAWEDIPEDERETWNKWVIQKYLSFNQDYVQVVNEIQKNSWQLPNDLLYKVYVDIIPKKSLYVKYIKSQNKKIYKDTEVEIIANYFEVSLKDAKEYIDTLPEEELKNIIEQYN